MYFAPKYFHFDFFLVKNMIFAIFSLYRIQSAPHACSAHAQPKFNSMIERLRDCQENISVKTFKNTSGHLKEIVLTFFLHANQN